MSRQACRLCTSEHLEEHLEARGFVLDRCPSCEFVQVRERPTPEQLRAIYGEAFFARSKYEDEFALRRENQRRMELLAQAAAPGARVLDAGCATGDFIGLAGERYDMWGLDVSAYATAEAREKHPRFASQIFTGFVEDQRFEPRFFDAIVMWDVIEHIWDPRPVLERLVDHLRPGGSLLLSTPDIGALTARLMGSRWAFMTPPEHLGFFNRLSLDFLLERTLGLRTTASFAKGKWANVGFIAYKLRKVFPAVPATLVAKVQQSPLGRASMYVPTGDVRYVSARKVES
jgi:SAM-dependent methyltransferase